MRFKKGVDPQSIKPELNIALFIIDGLYREEGLELVITSLNDSKHSISSCHYNGCAADLRIWGLKTPGNMVSKIAVALGFNEDYDVILEKDHIHIEYQPKRKKHHGSD